MHKVYLRRREDLIGLLRICRNQIFRRTLFAHHSDSLRQRDHVLRRTSPVKTTALKSGLDSVEITARIVKVAIIKHTSDKNNFIEDEALALKVLVPVRFHLFLSSGVMRSSGCLPSLIYQPRAFETTFATHHLEACIIRADEPQLHPVSHTVLVPRHTRLLVDEVCAPQQGSLERQIDSAMSRNRP